MRTSSWCILLLHFCVQQRVLLGMELNTLPTAAPAVPSLSAPTMSTLITPPPAEPARPTDAGSAPHKKEFIYRGLQALVRPHELNTGRNDWQEYDSFHDPADDRDDREFYRSKARWLAQKGDVRVLVTERGLLQITKGAVRVVDDFMVHDSTDAVISPKRDHLTVICRDNDKLPFLVAIDLAASPAAPVFEIPPEVTNCFGVSVVSQIERLVYSADGASIWVFVGKCVRQPFSYERQAKGLQETLALMQALSGKSPQSAQEKK